MLDPKLLVSLIMNAVFFAALLVLLIIWLHKRGQGDDSVAPRHIPRGSMGGGGMSGSSNSYDPGAQQTWGRREDAGPEEYEGQYPTDGYSGGEQYSERDQYGGGEQYSERDQYGGGEQYSERNQYGSEEEYSGEEGVGGQASRSSAPRSESDPIDVRGSEEEASADAPEPKKYTGIVAGSDVRDGASESVYEVQGYDFKEDSAVMEDIFGSGMSDDEQALAVANASGNTPTVEKREKPQKRTLEKPARCNICLGYIKGGLPLITCMCSKNYHLSCASRVEECPSCHTNLLDYEDKVKKNEDELEMAASKAPTDPREEAEKAMGIFEKDQLERLKNLLQKYDIENVDRK